MITLRDYQSDGIQRIRRAYAEGAKAPLYVLPCGGGKTIMFSAIAESSEKRGKRALILCHRIELVDQIVAALKDFGVTPDIIAAGYNRSYGRTRASEHSIAVASVQTLIRRLDSYVPPTLIVIDEAHRTAAATWTTILHRYRTAKVLGVTASPIRGDSKGLGSHFDRIIVGPSVTELTASGYLSPTRVFAPPTVDTSGLHIRMGDFKPEESEALLDAPAITGSALSHYKQHANGLPALVFCTSVKHAHHVAEQFRNDGIAALALDGGTDKDIRRMAVKDFKDGKISVITQCEIAVEGWDLPGVHCGIFLRPTASLGMWIQMMGRCSRPSPGKTHAILLDHVGNSERLGLAADERDWQLTYDAAKQKKKPPPGVRVCVKCFAASPARASVCVECGTAFEVKPRQEIDEREGELVELTADEIKRKRERREQGRSRSLAELEAFAKMKNYASGWAQHVWEAREKKRKSA
jgi:DNA repair protein RadD